MGISNRTKILIIDNSIDTTGGLKAILNTCCDLQHQFEFLFVLPTNSKCVGLIQQAGFYCLTIPFREIRKDAVAILLYLPSLILNSYRLARIIKSEKINIVHANDIYNLCGTFAKLFTTFRLITHIRILSSNFPQLLYNCWIWIHLRYSDKVVCVSQAAKSPFGQRSTVTIVPDRAPQNECYTYAYPPSDADGNIRLLYLANYIRGKGQNYALEAFGRAFSHHSNLRLVFAGSDMGLPKNSVYKQELIEKAKMASYGKGVSFKGVIQDIESEIKSAHLILNFSESESFSLTCQEALFFGTPLIATDCGGPRELFEHGTSGWLVRNKDVEEMAQAIIRLADDPVMRAQFSVNGRKHIRSKFGYEQTSGCLAKLYHQVAES
jgi:glycosyltransferase involved in cell wall biosynthesis